MTMRGNPDDYKLLLEKSYTQFRILNKIKDCIEQELEDAKENPTPKDVDSHEFGILDGREEFAEQLKGLIRKWEKRYE